MNRPVIHDGRKTVLATEGLAKPRGVWSAATATRPGGLVFVSGMLSQDEHGNVVGEGDIAAQTEQVLRNIQQALRAAGATLADVVRLDVFVTDISRFDAIHAVRARYFPVAPPASTMVEVRRFIDDRCLIEINAIAVVP